MEALLERGTDVESWNDDRLDELSSRMDDGFKEMRNEMLEGFAKVDKRFICLEWEIKKGFERLDDRIFKVMILMLIFCGGLLSAVVLALLGIGGS